MVGWSLFKRLVVLAEYHEYHESNQEDTFGWVKDGRKNLPQSCGPQVIPFSVGLELFCLSNVGSIQVHRVSLSM